MMDTREPITDTALVAAARNGDATAYGELFSRYQSRIYNYAYGIAGNREDAADITQEAFARVFEALPRLAGELNLSAYVYRTAHNLAIDTVKSRTRFAQPEALDMALEPSLRADPERVALVQEQQDQAWQAAFRLSENHRAILSLRELHDLSYQDIADIMGMPRNTVGVLLSRARLKFKEAFRMSSVDIDNLCAECRDMLPLLSAYIDNELNAQNRARVEEHLQQCAFCRLALEEMTESSRSYRAILPLLPPATLGEGLWTRLGDLTSRGQTEGDTGGNSESIEASDVPNETPVPRRAKSAVRLSFPKLMAIVAAAGAVLLLAVWLLTPLLLRDSRPSVETTARAGSSFTAVNTTGLPAVTSSDRDTTPPPTPRLIYPSPGQVVEDASVTLQWETVKDPSGVTYRLEVESFNENTGSYVLTVNAGSVATGEFAHHMHSTRERWRVTAVDGAGNKSAPTGWAEYTRSVATTRVVAPPTPATTAPPTTPPTPSPTLETVTSTITVTTVVSSTLPTITIPSITVPTVTTLRPLPTTTTIFVKK